MSLLVKNGKIYHNGVLSNKNIFVKSGKIAKITSLEIKAEKIIDARNKIIIPGLIDSHVHFREPGLTQKEDFLTGSMAAAAGGITTVLDMPNTLPPTTDLQRLEEKRKMAKKSIVNYGFHFGSTQDNIAEIEKVRNVASVKVYMDFTTGDMQLRELKALKKIFMGYKTICVHAENENILRSLDLIESSDNNLYICHVSSGRELKYAQKKIKNNVFVEVCPHHLFLDKKDVKKLEAFGEMKPGLKTDKDRKTLWDGIRNNKVNTIATDHAPHLKEEKLEADYPYGVPGCETMLPLLLNSLNEKKITLRKIIELCCENPAKIFRIRNKGLIKEGFDADLTVVDLEIEKEVRNSDLFTKCGWSPFDGWTLKGWPVTTIVNGEIVFHAQKSQISGTNPVGNGKINNIPAKEVVYHE